MKKRGCGSGGSNSVVVVVVVVVVEAWWYGILVRRRRENVASKNRRFPSPSCKRWLGFRLHILSLNQHLDYLKKWLRLGKTRRVRDEL